MTPKPKSNSVITHTLADGVVTFTVRDAGELRLNLASLSPEVRERALVHGMVQRVSDAAAIPFNKEEGRYATPQEKFEAMRALVEHYESGTTEWARKGGGAGGPRVDSDSSLILAAVARVQGVEVATMRERVKANAEKRGVSTRAYLSALLASEAVKAVYEELKAAQPVAKPAVDADEALKELRGEAA